MPPETKQLGSVTQRPWLSSCTVLTLSLSIGLAMLGCTGSHAPPDLSTPQAVYNERLGVPERRLRVFFQAFLDQDESRIRATTIACEKREVLWSFGQPVPASNPFQQFKSLPLRRVAVGETLVLPTPSGPRPLPIDVTQVNDGRVMLMLGDHPIPWILVRIKSEWLVDPRAFISGIEASRATRQSAPDRSLWH